MKLSPHEIQNFIKFGIVGILGLTGLTILNSLFGNKTRDSKMFWPVAILGGIIACVTLWFLVLTLGGAI